jgi:tetratricopeptide (TPR) repeat protein
MTRPLLLALCLTCASLTLVVSTTEAAYAEDSSTKAAKKLFDKGQKQFNLRKFESALELFQKAFDTKPLPGILFMIGQTHRNLGDNEAAIFSFKRYLKLAPDADNRDQVEDLIAELEDEIEQAKAVNLNVEADPGPTEKPIISTEPEPVREVPPGQSSGPIYKKWWFWTGVAVVAAGVGAGAYFATKTDAMMAPPTDLGVIEAP